MNSQMKRHHPPGTLSDVLFTDLEARLGFFMETSLHKHD